jgi:DNA-binding MarR family transcriptional regulator
MSSQAGYLATFNKLLLPTISKVQRLLSVSLESAIKSHDLSLAEFRIVGLLMGEEQGYSQKQLAKKLAISSPSLSVSITRLEEKQWIHRINDKQDLRIKRICVDPQADFAGIAQLINSLEKQATEGVTQQELKICLKVLNKILLNIHKGDQ